MFAFLQCNNYVLHLKLEGCIKYNIHSGSVSPHMVFVYLRPWIHLMWQVFEQFGNHVEEGTELNVHVDRMCFLDKQCFVQKVIVSHNVWLSRARQQGLNRCVCHICVWFRFMFQFFLKVQWYFWLVNTMRQCQDFKCTKSYILMHSDLKFTFVFD